MTSAKGHFIEFLISNIIGYLSFLQDQKIHSGSVTPSKEFPLLHRNGMRMIRVQHLRLSHTASSLWAYFFIGITLSGYNIAQGAAEYNME